MKDSSGRLVLMVVCSALKVRVVTVLCFRWSRNREELAKLISDLKENSTCVKKEEDSENSQDSLYTGLSNASLTTLSSPV